MDFPDWRLRERAAGYPHRDRWHHLPFSSNAWVFALDGASGRVIWEYHFTIGKGLSCKQNRGVAVGYGRVFLGTGDNHMVALDQKSGAELWRVNVEDSRQCGCNITGARPSQPYVQAASRLGIFGASTPTGAGACRLPRRRTAATAVSILPLK